jgi:hypothetical protein
MKMKIALAVTVERRKKWNPLNVVPMKVGKKNMCAHRVPVGFLDQLLAQIAKAGAAVEDVDVAVEAYFYTGSIASVAQIL